MKIDVMGVLFDNVTMEQALDRAETLMEAKASAYCVTPNGEIVWEAMQDPAFRSILNEADLVLPDGASVVLGSRILERPLQEKVAGIAFAEALVQRMAARAVQYSLRMRMTVMMYMFLMRMLNYSTILQHMYMCFLFFVHNILLSVSEHVYLMP